MGKMGINKHSEILTAKRHQWVMTHALLIKTE